MPKSRWVALFASIAVTSLLAVPVQAKPGPKSHAPKLTSPAPKASTSVKGPATRPVKTVKTTMKAAPGSAKVAKAPKPTKATKPTKLTGAAMASSAKTKKTTIVATTTNTSATASASTTPTTVWVPNNPVAQKLAGKPNQLSKAMAILPVGTDLNAATTGFKNFGQFNAAVNVSTNLGIPFADLKAAMTGTTITGEPTVTGTTVSLGQAIQQFKPGVNATTEAQRAEAQALLASK